jgi:3-oxoadipate enol-lactonase
MTAIMIGGEEFCVLVEGNESKPVLMVSNPLGTNLHFWDPQAPALLEHFRILRYDSRGHGKTLADHGPYSIQQLGHDALAIADALGIEKFHWLGLSKGSIVGLWLLIHARSRIGRAVLASTAAQMPPPDMWNSRIQSAREFGMEKTAAAAAERWFTKNFRNTEPQKVQRVLAMVRATSVQGYVASCAALRDMDLREAVRGITNEVLVIAGRHDLSTSPRMAALVASSIKGAKLSTLEAPHLSSIEDEANFIKAVLDFLTAPESVLPRTPSPGKKAAKKAAPRQRPTKKPTGNKTAVKKARMKTAAAKLSAAKAAAKRPRRVLRAPNKTGI